MKKRFNKAITLVLVVSLAALAAFTLISCSDKTEKTEILNLNSLNYLSELQESGELTFEWLNNSYSPSRPTAIIFHGETPGYAGNRFSMALDSNEYTLYSETNPTDYVVQKNISGYNNKGLNMDLSQYWITVARYNVAVFHWEGFADDDAAGIVSKFYTVPKMRYRNADGSYETVRVPKAPLAEIVASLYIEEMIKLNPNGLSGKEIRFIGNGVGANLALSVSHLVTAYYNAGLIDGLMLPQRLAMCDPYLNAASLYLNIGWDQKIDTSGGTLGVIDNMLSAVAGIGTAVEMIESKQVTTKQVEVVDENGNKSTENVKSEKFAYDIGRKTPAVKAVFDSILTKVAYLEYAESYSVKFSDKYSAKKRTALDWYLYSVIGSDDTAIGYPTTVPTTISSNYNWGPRDTRPIMNDRYATNDMSSSATAANRGKNFGVGAWTPTVYIRALRGISFTQKKQISNASSNVHGNMTYNYESYVMPVFCSENRQKSDQTTYTLVVGYVYLDADNDTFINDGVTRGIANAKVNFNLYSSKNTSEIVADFDVITDQSGFFVVRLNDKTLDANGDESKSGYKFTYGNDFTATLTYIVDNPRYIYQPTLASGWYYETLAGQNFSSATCSFTMNDYYADAIYIKNCLLAPESAE